MKLIILEPQCKNLEHLVFNSCVLRMARNYFSAYDITLYAENEHIKYLQESVQVKHFGFELPKGKGHILAVKRILFDLFLALKINKQKPDCLICLSVTPFTVLFSKILIHNAKTFFFFHGVLENLYQKFHIYNYLYYLRPALRIKKRDCVNIVLSKNIKRELQKTLPVLINVETFGDPRPQKSFVQAYSFPANISIATFGFGAIEKGSDKIFELEAKLADCVSIVKLFYIGNIKNDKRVQIPQNTKVHILGGNGPLSPEEYDNAIETMHYCVFFYPRNTYRLAASGVIIDALTHLKPVIALRNPYFEYVFSKMSDVGYLCDTIDEIAASVKKITAEKDIAKYRKQQENISAGLVYFSPEYLENKFRKIMSKYIDIDKQVITPPPPRYLLKGKREGLRYRYRTVNHSRSYAQAGGAA